MNIPDDYVVSPDTLPATLLIADEDRLVIIGAGPAGLTAAYELQRRTSSHTSKMRPLVLEATHMVGGISRTEAYKGNRFDIGGHRFFTKVREVEQMWQDVLGSDLITVSRKSRIFYKNRFFSYPLQIFNALNNIGIYESFRVILSYAKWKIRPHATEETFDRWVTNRFGGRLYMHFFRTYTEKVWGIPPDRIQADWAAQRIKNLSLPKAIYNAISGRNDTSSLIEEFQYPRLGPGMMWEKTRDLVVKNGGTVELGVEVVKVNREGNLITSVEVRRTTPYGKTLADLEEISGTHFINTMALDDLVAAMNPPAPEEVRAAASRLRYRDFLIVALQLDIPDPFPDNWIYIHSPAVKVGRIQNFRAWSDEMVADSRQSSIGMEYFCQQDDDLWSTSDEDLKTLATAELMTLGLGRAENVVGAAVIRQPKAYPVYDGEYREALSTLETWLQSLENFQTVGRNGLHRYNNQDHSMLSAMLAVGNVLGETNDVWNVNVERSYHEDFEVQKST